MIRSSLNISIIVTICVFTLITGVMAVEKLPRPLPGTMTDTGGTGKRFITIDFDNVDIRLFIKYISELTGKNFVVDKTIQGNVTIVSPTKISEKEAYRVFESVLEVHGFTTVKAGSVIKILPSARARSQNVEMLQMGFSDHPEDKVVTQLVPLKYSSPLDLKKVLTPLVSKSSVVIAHTPSGMLIITETLSNIQKLLAIIKVLDVESREDEVVVVQLKNASSSSLAKILNTIFQKTSVPQKGAKSGAKSRVKVVPYERVNALVVLASSGEIERVKSLIALLDTKVQRNEGNIHVIYLQNATATELAKVLNALPETQAVEKEKGKAPAISKNVKVMPDEETNSLIITASREEYEVLEGVIKKLDIPRRMVYLEALIMEVDVEETFDVGVRWVAGGAFGDGTGRLVSGFGSNTDFGMFENTEGALPGLAPGFSLGVLKQGIEIGGVTFPNIAAVLSAYKTDDAINIISTPQILTTDNKKAEISVGENVPYITSQNTTDAGVSGQDYTQYEYRDVSTKLTITPHINQADTLRLEIATEVIKLKGNDPDNFTPTTLKRTAETTVIVKDGDTVVIGGIIGQDAAEIEGKIPFLGDIPLLGWLFKSRSTLSQKTNMFIFITPRIIKNPANIAAVTLEKEDDLGRVLPSVQQELHKEKNMEHAVKLTITGYEMLMADNVQAAKEYFIEALDINPDNSFALMNMGVVFEREGKSEKALKMYQTVISVGTTETAFESSNQEKNGALLIDIARENIDRLMND